MFWPEVIINVDIQDALEVKHSSLFLYQSQKRTRISENVEKRGITFSLKKNKIIRIERELMALGGRNFKILKGKGGSCNTILKRSFQD